ncbi:MAG: type transport system ATP-binding protein [Actinomycetota bacterium]|jgi:ABC-2 type transport system ATP-binding protein|nr:type transport system ATP-binding protein [Actinomycetota bacterium]
MRSPRLLAALALVASTALSTAAPLAHADAVPAPGDDRVGANAPYTYTTRNLRIPVSDPDMFGNPVTLDARVLVPNGTGPFAGLLINHGYLGDKGGDSDTAERAARLGYIVLRYTSRGFGAATQPDPTKGQIPSPAPVTGDGQGTLGQVDLVGGPETHDMVQAVAWLNNPNNVPIWVDHIGHYGGSYGGAHDYALAQQDLPAVKALVPAATWTDLYDGLAPNGVLKAAYMSGFYAAGRERFDGYNNYDPEIDAGYAKMLTSTDLDGLHAMLKDHSISGKWNKVHTPIFLVQGLNDGLFDGNEAIQSYIELKKNLDRAGNPLPVHLYLGGIGHPPARSGGGYEIEHVYTEVLAFFDHYVREIDNGIEKAPPIEFATTQYFDNPDFAVGEAGITARARAADVAPVGDKLPFGTSTTLQLCGSTTPGVGTLQAAACPAAPPALLAAGTGGDPTSEPVVGHPDIAKYFQQYFGRPFPDTSTPVDVVRFDGPALSAATTYAGIPTLKLSVVSDPPTTGLGGPTPPVAAFQIDPKVYDVAPDGTAKLITRGAYAEQPGGGAPGVHTSTFDAFAMAWTFPAGHHLRLSLSSADVPYLRPNAAAFQVAVLPGSVVEMPGAEDATLTPFGVTPPPATGVPEVPYAALLPIAGLAVAGAVVARRRRRAG